MTVTATDSHGHHGTVTFHIVAVPDLRAAYHPVTGEVWLNYAVYKQAYKHLCLDDAGGSSRDGTKVQIWSCDRRRASQSWTYLPDARPDGSGTLTIHGRCLDIAGNGQAAGSKVQLSRCTGAGNQSWSLAYGAAWLYNPASGQCLSDPAAGMTPRGLSGTQLEIGLCLGLWTQFFTVPPGPVMFAVHGLCLTDPGNTTVSGTPVAAQPCNGTRSQIWANFSDSGEFTAFTGHGNLCLTAVDPLPGSPVKMLRCGPNAPITIIWFPTTDGEVMNIVGLCLDDPHPAAVGTARLVLANCTGQLGEIWAVG